MLPNGKCSCRNVIRTKLAKLLPVVLLVEFRALRYVNEAIFVINILGLLNILGRKCLFWRCVIALSRFTSFPLIWKKVKLVSSFFLRVTEYPLYREKEPVLYGLFSKVIVDGLCCNHVMCKSCNTVLKWKSKDGTGGLKAHLQACESGGAVRKLTECAGVARCRNCHPLVTPREDVTNAIVRYGMV